MANQPSHQQERSPPVGVDDVEADELAAGLDADHGVGGSAADGFDDVRQGAEEAFDLDGVKFKSADVGQAGAAEAAVAEGLDAPDRRHDTLRVTEADTR